MLYFNEPMVFSHRHKRPENQDRAFYMAFNASPTHESNMQIFAVLDGVSNSNGSVAAPMAAAALRPRLAQLIVNSEMLLDLEVLNGTRANVIWDTLKLAIQDAHHCLRSHGDDYGDDYGTTITLAVVFDGAVYTANIGDSPAYLLRLSDDGAATLHPLFECHNAAGLAVAEGKMTPEEARTSPLRNGLQHMAGAKAVPELNIHTACSWLPQYSILLLGSDGALSVLPEQELIELVQANAPAGMPAVVTALFQRIQDSDSTDNFTVIAQSLQCD